MTTTTTTPKMTVRRFHDLFRKCLLSYAWRSRRSGGSLRGTRIVDGTEQQFCPVTALYFCETGEYMSPMEYLGAAKLMGLGRNSARYIATAADMKPGTFKYPATAGRKLEADFEAMGVIPAIE